MPAHIFMAAQAGIRVVFGLLVFLHQVAVVPIFFVFVKFIKTRQDMGAFAAIGQNNRIMIFIEL